MYALAGRVWSLSRRWLCTKGARELREDWLDLGVSGSYSTTHCCLRSRHAASALGFVSFDSNAAVFGSTYSIPDYPHHGIPFDRPPSSEPFFGPFPAAMFAFSFEVFLILLSPSSLASSLYWGDAFDPPCEKPRLLGLRLLLLGFGFCGVATTELAFLQKKWSLSKFFVTLRIFRLN